MHESLTLRAENISKRFTGKKIFSGVNLSLSAGDSMALTGPNGSGKSTLLKILAGLMLPTSGKTIASINGDPLSPESFKGLRGFVSPEILPYGELSCVENLEFVLGPDTPAENIPEGLARIGLYSHGERPVKELSSGMRQRLRFLLAMVNNPPLIFLDEPGMNLDVKGRDAVYEWISTLSRRHIVIIAANDPAEIKLCGEVFSIV